MARLSYEAIRSELADSRDSFAESLDALERVLARLDELIETGSIISPDKED